MDPDDAPLLASRSWLRERLRQMTDDELLAFCIVAKRDERANKERGDYSQQTLLAWYECLNRDREGIYFQALEAIKQEEAKWRHDNWQAHLRLLARLDRKHP